MSERRQRRELERENKLTVCSGAKPTKTNNRNRCKQKGRRHIFVKNNLNEILIGDSELVIQSDRLDFSEALKSKVVFE